jgi:type IV pilus assembly protein PilA
MEDIMLHTKTLTRGQEGFTLVELMIVVAIIGILSAIAVPNFKKYQAKSKTSEAKIQLAAAYTAEVSFYGDFDSYHYCLRYMGYDPSNEVPSRYYAIGFPISANRVAYNDLVQGAGAITGAAGSGACATGLDESFYDAGKALGSTPAMDVAGFNAVAALNATVEVPTSETFVIGAAGYIEQDNVVPASASAMSIDELKFIRLYQAGY